MASKKKVAKRPVVKKQENVDNEGDSSRVELKKLKDTEVNALKGKLLEVRRIGAHPIFVEINQKDSVSKALEKADVPTSDTQIKVEGVRQGSAKWETLTLSSIVYPFAKIAVTTKVKGSF